MKIGAVVYFKASDETIHLAVVTSLHQNYLIAVEGNKNEVKLEKGQAHRVHNTGIEADLAVLCGLKKPFVLEAAPNEDDDEEVDDYEEDEDEPLDPEE